MFIEYPSTSPYAVTPQTGWYIDLYKHRPIEPHKADRRLILTQRYHLRPDLLSHDLYGTPSYWWVFLVRNINVIRDPIWDFEVGKAIYVPSVDHLRTIIG